MDGDDEVTTHGRGRRVALAVLWAVVVPVGLGIGLAEGRIRFEDRPAQAQSTVPPTTAATTALTTTSTTAPFNVGTRPPEATTSTVAPYIGSDAFAREVVWYQLADCESGAWSQGVPLVGSARWDIVARGYQGGLQFHPVTWDRFRAKADPAEANVASSVQQIAVAEKVLSREGVNAWPTCGPRVGLSRLLAPGHVPIGGADFLPAAEPTVLDDE